MVGRLGNKIFILWWTMSDGHDEWVKPIGLSMNLPFLQIELVTVWATVCISPKNITKIMTGAIIWNIHRVTFSIFVHYQAHFLLPFLGDSRRYNVSILRTFFICWKLYHDAIKHEPSLNSLEEMYLRHQNVARSCVIHHDSLINSLNTPSCHTWSLS